MTACHKSVQAQQFVEATLMQAMDMPEMQQLMQEQDIDFPTSRRFFTE